MNTNKKTARMAGFLYFIYMVIHIFADVFGRSKLIVLGDAAATAQNIMASEWQFRIGFVSDLLAAVLFLLTAWALYVLLKPVNKNLAMQPNPACTRRRFAALYRRTFCICGAL